MKMYLEFKKQEYYGLITVESHPNLFYVDEAAEVYAETVAGESANEVLEEGQPELVTKEYAFWKLANCDDNGNMTVDEILKEFDELENTCIVVDGALV